MQVSRKHPTPWSITNLILPSLDRIPAAPLSSIKAHTSLDSPQDLLLEICRTPPAGPRQVFHVSQLSTSVSGALHRPNGITVNWCKPQASLCPSDKVDPETLMHSCLSLWRHSDYGRQQRNEEIHLFR